MGLLKIPVFTLCTCTTFFQGNYGKKESKTKQKTSAYAVFSLPKKLNSNVV